MLKHDILVIGRMEYSWDEKVSVQASGVGVVCYHAPKALCVTWNFEHYLPEDFH